MYYVYGGGMVGCLFDYGPNYTEDKQDAIDSLVELYLGSLTDDDIESVHHTIYHYTRTVDEIEAEMRACLAQSSTYYFPSSLRSLIGADYCSVSESEGDMPEDGDE